MVTIQIEVHEGFGGWIATNKHDTEMIASGDSRDEAVVNFLKNHGVKLGVNLEVDNK